MLNNICLVPEKYLNHAYKGKVGQTFLSCVSSLQPFTIGALLLLGIVVLDALLLLGRVFLDALLPRASSSIREVSNSEILWIVLLDDDRVEVNYERFVALLDGMIPNPTPRTRPRRSRSNTRAYTSSLDQRIPLPSSPCSRMPSWVKSSSILSYTFSH